MASPAYHHRVARDFESIGNNHHERPIYAVSAGPRPRPVGSRYLRWRCLPLAASGSRDLYRANIRRHGSAALVSNIRPPSLDSIFRSPFRLGATRLHVRLLLVTTRESENIHARKRQPPWQLAIRPSILGKSQSVLLAAAGVGKFFNLSSCRVCAPFFRTRRRSLPYRPQMIQHR